MSAEGMKNREGKKGIFWRGNVFDQQMRKKRRKKMKKENIWSAMEMKNRERNVGIFLEKKNIWSAEEKKNGEGKRRYDLEKGG